MKRLDCAAKAVAVLVLVSCAEQPGGLPRAQARAGDPALDGLDYLLSETDFRAVLSVARQRIVELRLPCTVSRVSVRSPKKVEAHFCECDFCPYRDWGGTFVLERVRGEWKVVDQWGGLGPPKNGDLSQRVII